MHAPYFHHQVQRVLSIGDQRPGTLDNGYIKIATSNTVTSIPHLQQEQET